MNKYEQLIDYIINEQEDKARELFHTIVVEKSRDIYESLIDEADFDEAIGGNQVDHLVDEVEADEAETEEGEVGRHDVCCVLGTAKAGLDEGEPRLHEHHERGTDDDPQQVHADVTVRELGGRGPAGVGAGSEGGPRHQEERRHRQHTDGSDTHQTSMAHLASSCTCERNSGPDVRWGTYERLISRSSLSCCAIRTNL